MPVTPDDIRCEHEAAMASLTDAQCHSIWRERHARQMTNFNGLTQRQNLDAIFEREAQARNAAEVERQRRVRASQANDNKPAAPPGVTAGRGH